MVVVIYEMGFVCEFSNCVIFLYNGCVEEDGLFE